MRRFDWARGTLCVVAGLTAMVSGCELIASIDRTKITRAENTAGRGTLERYEDGFVIGWAMGEPPDLPVLVRIEVNGDATIVSADEPRDDLLQQGIHPNGNAGFRTDVGVLAPGTEIRAFVHVTNVELANSPLLLEGGGAGGAGGAGGSSMGGAAGMNMGGTNTGGMNTGGMTGGMGGTLVGAGGL